MISVHFLIALSTVSAYITRCRYINSTTCFSALNLCPKIDHTANTTIYAKFNELQEFRPGLFTLTLTLTLSSSVWAEIPVSRFYYWSFSSFKHTLLQLSFQQIPIPINQRFLSFSKLSPISMNRFQWVYGHIHGEKQILTVLIMSNTNMFDNFNNNRKRTKRIILIHQSTKFINYSNIRTSLIQKHFPDSVSCFLNTSWLVRLSVRLKCFMDTPLHIGTDLIVREIQCNQCLLAIVNKWLNEK
jgi:hypothetical protein